MYTNEMCKKMIDYIPEDFWLKKDIKILDPCCGNGNFGAYCLTKTSIENIYFNDINEKRIKKCIELLNPKYISNIDALKIEGSYDLIMANPPYSGGGNKNKSLSNLFIEKGIDLLNEKGYLCYITPNNWMSFNNNNNTLKRLLNEGSFLVIDNDAKKFFPQVGSSFTIFIWQKGVFDNKTTVFNNFLVKDIQTNVLISKELKFLPLYISNEILEICLKTIGKKRNSFNYRCDLHNHTKSSFLKDIQDSEFKYKTIHTPNITRYASIKQDIYEKWLIIVPLSNFYKPYIVSKSNTTQSVGYFAFDSENDAQKYLKKITEPLYKLLIHITRYGNFNNISVLKYLLFDKNIKLNKTQENKINKLISFLKY
ncbi:hypothetical protein EGN60_01555 [Mycoplasma struthionis]|uniref:site-specific DNA-methyltransferase (adenine-specific) n=2 Tax=Mycoplasma struthionis TaxID=538220 RepID=A0A3G8LIE1_9MOLU|nr:hypothetical protein EGN60_01555 [Mycoplasma struthionis]